MYDFYNDNPPSGDRHADPVIPPDHEIASPPSDGPSADNVSAQPKYPLPGGNNLRPEAVLPDIASERPTRSAGNSGAASHNRRVRVQRVVPLWLCLLICAVTAVVCTAVTNMLRSSDRTAENDPVATTVTAAYQTSLAETTRVPETSVTAPPVTAPLNQNLTAAEIYRTNVVNTVLINESTLRAEGFGSGFILSEDGYIVTNYHVVSDGGKLTVSTYDGKNYTPRLVGYEESNDIALLKIDTTCLSPITYGISSDLNIGDPLYVIGNPLGDLTFTLTVGVVSAKDRLIKTETNYIINMFQTDAAINAGNSGGPVYNGKGQLVGIATAKYNSSSIEGLSFCIPIDDVGSIINELYQHGYVTGKPMLSASVFDTVVNSLGFIGITSKINGAQIESVTAGGAAAAAGLSAGDIITAVGEYKVNSVSALKTAMSNYRAGDTVTFTVNRGGSSRQMSVRFDEYSPSGVRTPSGNYSYYL